MYNLSLIHNYLPSFYGIIDVSSFRLGKTKNGINRLLINERKTGTICVIFYLKNIQPRSEVIGVVSRPWKMVIGAIRYHRRKWRLIKLVGHRVGNGWSFFILEERRDEKAAYVMDFRSPEMRCGGWEISGRKWDVGERKWEGITVVMNFRIRLFSIRWTKYL